MLVAVRVHDDAKEVLVLEGGGEDLRHGRVVGEFGGAEGGSWVVVVMMVIGWGGDLGTEGTVWIWSGEFGRSDCAKSPWLKYSIRNPR